MPWAGEPVSVVVRIFTRNAPPPRTFGGDEDDLQARAPGMGLARALWLAAAEAGNSASRTGPIPPPSPPPTPRITVIERCVPPSSVAVASRITVIGRRFPAGARVGLGTRGGFPASVRADDRGEFESARLKAPFNPIPRRYQPRIVTAQTLDDDAPLSASAAYLLAKRPVCGLLRPSRSR